MSNYDRNHTVTRSTRVVLIKINKTMSAYINNILEGNQLTVAELAISDAGALAVFTKYNIDYCCGGHRSLEDACRRIGLDPEKIRAEISQLPKEQSTPALRPESWNSAFLADYIIQNHHTFVRNAIPELKILLDKVCDAHGDDCEELLKIRENFASLSEELLSHMDKEELVLFPAIKRLEAQHHSDHPLAFALQTPISAMEHEHVIAGSLVKKIRELSNNYTSPDFACPTFRITYKKLKEFDSDLMIHIHLENNILFERLRNNLGKGDSCSL